jgi:hypothetical protein
MSLLRIFMQGGFVMWPLAVIVLVLIGIVIRTLWHLTVRGGNRAAVIQSSLDGLLFWGGFAVLIGLLGSMIGYHKAMSILVARGLVDPRAVWMGSAEGMVSTLAGLAILCAAGAAWFALRWQFLRTRPQAR